jgi:hypothetical protein
MVRTSLSALPLVLASFAASCGGEKKEVLVPAAEVAPRTTPLQTVEAIAEQRCNTRRAATRSASSVRWISAICLN